MSGTILILSAINSVSAVMWWRFFLRNQLTLSIRVEFFGDEIDRISEINPLNWEN